VRLVWCHPDMSARLSVLHGGSEDTTHEGGVDPMLPACRRGVALTRSSEAPTLSGQPSSNNRDMPHMHKQSAICCTPCGRATAARDHAEGPVTKPRPPPAPGDALGGVISWSRRPIVASV
jgi:hypothetical protein